MNSKNGKQFRNVFGNGWEVQNKTKWIFVDIPKAGCLA